MRVLIVDDSAELRMLLELLITADCPDWQVVGNAANGHAAIAQAGALSPDLVLLDASMPLLDGLTALPGIRAAAPQAKVVMLSAFPASQLRAAALEAGAIGFIEKNRLTEELIPALAAILEAARSAD